MIKISFLGDMMCEPLLLKAARRGDTYDFSGVFEHVMELLSESDYIAGNLETPLAGKKARYVKELFSFNAPDEFAAAIKDAGINFVSTANNHCMDRGLDGLKRTIAVLDRIGLAHDGTHETCGDHDPFVATIGDTRVAIIPFTYGANYALHHNALPDQRYADFLRAYTDSVYAVKRNIIYKAKILIKKPFKFEHIAAIKKALGMTYNTPIQDNHLDEQAVKPYFERLKKKIDRAKQTADLVIFYPHVGGQFNIEPGKFTEYTITKGIEFGADAVIASHPHIVQKAANINGVPVFYSIGNFSMSPNSVYLLHENLPEYGIIPHLYVEGSKIKKVTFSIIKIIEDRNRMLSVFPVNMLDDSDDLRQDVAKIYKTVSARELRGNTIESEYPLFG